MPRSMDTQKPDPYHEPIKTQEDHAGQFIKDNAGVILYRNYTAWCKIMQREPLDFLAFCRVMLQTLGVMA